MAGRRIAVEDRTGTVCCAVRRALLADKIYLLSCRHVFSGTHGAGGNLAVTLEEGGPQLGVTRGLRGPFSEFRNLDAQFAELTESTLLSAVMGDYNFEGYATDTSNLPGTYWILTARGPLEAKFDGLEQDYKLSYNQPQGMLRVRHGLLIRSRFSAGGVTTEPGDSGAALATSENGGRLLGMHIYLERGTSLAIPARDLFDPRRYIGGDPAEQWSLLSNSSHEIVALGATAAAPLPPLDMPAWIAALCKPHSMYGGVAWQLATDGVRIAGAPATGTPGEPATVALVWNKYHEPILKWCKYYDVPVELVIATICTESGGKADAQRKEPGYLSDERTPAKVSAGLMQTLIDTARRTLANPTLSRAELLVPTMSIKAGTAYITQQRSRTGMDPVKVACAYNAGGLYENSSANNRWKLRQYPIDSSKHADRFVPWFNDCFRHFDADKASVTTQLDGTPSLWRALR